MLLWFGTWKNGSQHYMPEWMKLEPEKYSHVVNKRGEPVDSPSPFAQASLDADIHAFTAFMKHLKTADPQHTVLMVQVENETGTWGTLRDYSPQAEKLFAAPVPADVLKAMNVSPGSRTANWQDVFGTEAEVNFHAWAIARYVGQIAAAGKAVYPLPLYVNAALRDPIKPGAPGSYESGGPTDNVLNIWKAEAPAIDVLAPDIYSNDTATYLKVLDLYHRPDNALFVPETSSSASTARFFFAALGLQAIGYSPFGLDYTRTPAPQPGAATTAQDSFLQPTAQNYHPHRPHDARHRPPQLRGQAAGRGGGAGQACPDAPLRRLGRVRYLRLRPWRRPQTRLRADRARPGRATQGQPVSGHRNQRPRGLPPSRDRAATQVPADREWKRTDPLGPDRRQVAFTGNS